MKHLIRSTAIAALSLFVLGAVAGGPKPSESELLASIKAIQDPKLDVTKERDQAYIRQYIADRSKASAERNKLILEFYHDYPDSEEVPALMEKRWSTLRPASQEELNAAIQETTSIAAAANASPKLKTSAAYWETSYKMRSSGGDADKMLAAVEEFTKAYPKDERGARLLMSVGYQVSDQTKLLAIDKEIVDNYPGSTEAGYAAGGIRRATAVGKPFDLSFTDAVTGKNVSIADLKGKVVLIDFWATWCGPCVGEMPKMKELYAQYHSKGLEVVGVSLDQPEAQGGLKALKDFVAKNDIPWAQYYQGNFWNSKFSTSWGINSIPTLFIVDKSGNLLDVNGRDKLETKVADLLK